LILSLPQWKNTALIDIHDKWAGKNVYTLGLKHFTKEVLGLYSFQTQTADMITMTPPTTLPMISPTPICDPLFSEAPDLLFEVVLDKLGMTVLQK
jgi:hypothetical protein